MASSPSRTSGLCAWIVVAFVIIFLGLCLRATSTETPTPISTSDLLKGLLLIASAAIVVAYISFCLKKTVPFSMDLHIHAPRDLVWEYVTDSDKMKTWREGYLGSEQIEGEAKTPGAKSREKFSCAGSEMEGIMTIEKFDEPANFVGSIYIEGMFADTMAFDLEELADEETFLKIRGNTQWLGFLYRALSPFFVLMSMWAVKKEFNKMKRMAEEEATRQ